MFGGYLNNMLQKNYEKRSHSVKNANKLSFFQCYSTLCAKKTWVLLFCTGEAKNMITKEEAIKLVEKQLSKIEMEDNFRIDEQNTEEHDWGWVIYYNTERFLESDDVQLALMGNGPFIVYKESGKIVSVSSSDLVDNDIDSWLQTDEK